MPTWMIWVFVAYGVTLIYGIIRTVDWYSFFDRRWGNDPLKCKVYVDYGENEKFYDGEYAYVDDRYIFYNYQVGKETWAVAVPQSYKWVFVRGRRKICVDYGKGVAKPVSGKADTTVGAVDLAPALESKLGIALVKSIKSRQAFKTSTLFLVIALAVVGVLFYNTYQEKRELQRQEQIEQAQQQQPAGNIEDAIIQSGGEIKQ